jgi:NUMOD3 motif
MLNIRKIFYVYLYEDEKGVPIYVGRGQGTRIRHHLRYTALYARKRPHPFHHKLRSILEKGFKPKFYKVKEGLTAEEANNLEIELIKKIGRKDLGLGTLLNLCDGGEGLLNMSESHKSIIRQTHTGKVNSIETKRRMSVAKKGIRLTDEHKLNLSKSLKGKPQPEAAVQKRKGKIWINDKVQSLYIEKNKLTEYLNNGWFRGRLSNISEESRQRMSDSAKKRIRPIHFNETMKKILSGREWINNSKINKFVKVNTKAQFLLDGWENGRMPIKTHRRNDRRWINNGIVNKQVYKEELEKFCVNGWKQGQKEKD